jgi:hypothetical protein
VLNDALFVLTGLELHRIVIGLGPDSWPFVVSLSGIVIAVVVGLRLLWFGTVPYLIRAIDRRPGQRTRRLSARHRFPIAWAGMRGSISLPSLANWGKSGNMSESMNLGRRRRSPSWQSVLSSVGPRIRRWSRVR